MQRSATHRGRMTTRRLLPAAAAALAVVLTSGCFQTYAAERDGLDLGELLCDLRDATTEASAARIEAEIREEVDQLAGQYAMFTAEDRADIANNVADLRVHAGGSDILVQQDLAAIRRSLANIEEDLDRTSQAAWDGVKLGLDGCITR